MSGWSGRRRLAACLSGVLLVVLGTAAESDDELSFAYVAITGQAYVMGTVPSEDAPARVTANGGVHIKRTGRHIVVLVRDAVVPAGTDVPVSISLPGTGRGELVCVPVDRPHVVRTNGAPVTLQLYGPASNYGVYPKDCHSHAITGTLTIRR